MCLLRLAAAGHGKAVLAPSLENGHGHGVGEVQAALAGHHGQAHALAQREAVAQLGREAAGLAAKHQPVAD